MTGLLTVVGTPIGNLGDISPRAVEALAKADFICCEDSRRTGRLLSHLGIKSPGMIVVNEHTEAQRADTVADRVLAGEQGVLVSDAGMPMISDPGHLLVSAVLECGAEVDVVPGPVAFVAAAVVSGLVTGPFVFEGFVPRKGAARRRRLEALRAEKRSVIFYEAPHRLRKTLGDLANVFGSTRRACAARELTKLHQEIIHADLGHLSKHYDEVEPRGEFVVVVGPDNSTPALIEDDDLIDALVLELDAGGSKRDAVSAVVQATGESKKRVYDLAIGLGSEGSGKPGF